MSYKTVIHVCETVTQAHFVIAGRLVDVQSVETLHATSLLSVFVKALRHSLSRERGKIVSSVNNPLHSIG